MNNTDFIDQYFAAATLGAWMFIVVAAASLLVAGALLWRRGALLGMAWPLLAIAAVQLAIGVTVLQRSDAQALQSQQRHALQPLSFRLVETQRMQGVIGRIELARRAAIGLLAIGMALVVLLRRRRFWVAFGLGLVLQAGAVLVLDHFALDRARHYLTAVRDS